MSAFTYRNGRLHAEDAALEDIAAAHGTPLYCYSAARIADNFTRWQRALTSVMPEDRFIVCYACKANSNMAVMTQLAHLGAGADVVSGGELERARRAGVPPRKTVFSGVGKSAEELKAAISLGILQINVESRSELELISKLAQEMGKTATVALRINPDVDAKTHAKITTGLSENKFGIDLPDAPALYAHAATLPGIQPTGIAIHIGSQLMDLAPYREAFTHLAELVMQLRQNGIVIETIDLGGGLGIPYEGETPPDLNAYAALVRDIILPLGAHVVVEPGRSIVGDAGVLLSRVLHIKQGHARRFLILDAGMNDLMRPALYDARHAVLPCREDKNGTTRADVVGPVCETADTFLLDAELPASLAPGDLVAIMTAGAYGAVMSSAYNTRPPAGEAMVRGSDVALIRRPETADSLIGRDIIPAWKT